MKERHDSLASHQKAFKQAKTLAERIECAKLAAKDTDFLPVHPKRLYEDLAVYNNKGKGVLFLDVDDVLLSESRGQVLLNDEFIRACVKEGYTEVVLVTSMSLKVDNAFNRVDLIAYLALSGIQVKGLVAEADAAPEAALGDFYEDYYQAIMSQDPNVFDKLAKKQAARMASAESEHKVYLEAQGKEPSAFGKKLMIMRKLLLANLDIEKLIFVDDSIINLNGVVYDFLNNPYHAAVLCMLPVVKMSSEADHPTTAKQYISLLRQFDRGRREPLPAYRARIETALFRSQLINLNQRTMSGTKLFPEFDAFRASLTPGHDALGQKHPDVARVFEQVYGALVSDGKQYLKSLAKPGITPSELVKSAVIFERFSEMENALLLWQKKLLPERPLPAKTLTQRIEAYQAKKTKVDPHALSRQSMLNHSAQAGGKEGDKKAAETATLKTRKPV